MIRYNIKKFNEEDKTIFLEMVPYISQNLNRYKVVENYIEIYCDEKYETDITNKLKELENILGIIEEDNSIETQIVEDYTHNIAINNENVFNKLLKSRDIREISKGSFAYAGVFLEILQYFDKKIDEFAYAHFSNVRKEVYPDLHPIEDYVQGRYFETFPHYMMFQTEMRNDLEVYEEFSKCKGNIEKVLKEVKVPQNVLRHAACAPLYSSLQNKVINKNQAESFIVSGKCFRNEEANICELSRLNEFYMKEFVFIGDEKIINDLIEKSKELIRFWVKVFKLNSKYETANDSFFANNYKKLKFFQLIGNSKQEFKVLIPSRNDYIACSSINYHRTHFSKPYQIKDDDGNYCYSACFAFGIERLAYSFLSQKGLDYKEWDEETIKEIKGYIKIGD